MTFAECKNCLPKVLKDNRKCMKLLHIHYTLKEEGLELTDVGQDYKEEEEDKTVSDIEMAKMLEYNIAMTLSYRDPQRSNVHYVLRVHPSESGSSFNVILESHTDLEAVHTHVDFDTNAEKDEKVVKLLKNLRECPVVKKKTPNESNKPAPTNIKLPNFNAGNLKK